MLRSRSNEIPELVHRLGSRKPTCVDAARARLSIIGPRAVEDLIEALEGDNHRIRARVMPLLALIQDSLGRGPLVAMLLDRSSKLREIAARSLARFPSPETMAALHRVLDKERSEKVKVAAVQALVEQYAAGQDRALYRCPDCGRYFRSPYRPARSQPGSRRAGDSQTRSGGHYGIRRFAGRGSGSH